MIINVCILGEHVRQYWTCKWALQICSNHVLYNHEIAAKLRKHDSVTLAAVCEWINSSYDGILNSVTEENECLKFEIRMFSKQMHLKFCKSWAKNEAQYKLQCILLDKELLVPGNKFADRYSIRFMQYEMSKPHKGATSYEAEDGCESDDSAFSSSSHQIQSYKPLSQVHVYLFLDINLSTINCNFISHFKLYLTLFIFD